MEQAKQKQVLINEEMVQHYFELNKKAKEIERELSKLKKTFNQYFDLAVGENQKGELTFDSVALTRQIRVSEKLHEEEAVRKLEELNLLECIKLEKKVDVEKVEAAQTLGLVPSDILNEYKERRHSAAIVVKEV